MNKLVFYTAVLGGKDKLRPPKLLTPNADYVCFTDDRSYKSNVYRVVYVPRAKDPLLAAKAYKLLPYKYVGEYEFSVWYDGSLQPVLDMRDYVQAVFKDASLAFFEHPWYDCLYDEGMSCIKRGRWKPNELWEQLKAYREAGMPPHHGLIRGGVIFRRNTAAVRKLMRAWWNEILTHTPRDQISFPFVAWQHKAKYKVLPDKDFNKFFHQIPHRHYLPGDDRAHRGLHRYHRRKR